MQNQQCSSAAEKRKGTEKRRASGGGPELDLKERLRKKQEVGSVAHGQPSVPQFGGRSPVCGHGPLFLLKVWCHLGVLSGLRAEKT